MIYCLSVLYAVCYMLYDYFLFFIFLAMVYSSRILHNLPFIIILIIIWYFNLPFIFILFFVHVKYVLCCVTKYLYST